MQSWHAWVDCADPGGMDLHQLDSHLFCAFQIELLEALIKALEQLVQTHIWPVSLDQAHLCWAGCGAVSRSYGANAKVVVQLVSSFCTQAGCDK